MSKAKSASLIVVVDDDERVCRALSRVLSLQGYRVRTFTSARDYLAERDRFTPTCIVADVRMPELDGLALHDAEHALGGDTPTVFITASGDVATTVRAMKAGAADFLEKPFDDEAFLAAVASAVARSEHALDERRSLAELWRHLQRLTPREAEVCGLVVSGRLNKQIAAAIGTTEKTVKVHRARVMQKMGVASLAQLVRIVDRALRESGTRTILTHASAPLSRPRALAIIESVLKREPRDSGDIPAIHVDDAPLSDAVRQATDDVSVSTRTMDQGAIHD